MPLPPGYCQQNTHNVQNLIGLFGVWSATWCRSHAHTKRCQLAANRNSCRQTSRASGRLRLMSISSLSSEFNSSDIASSFLFVFEKKRENIQHLWSYHNDHSANVARLHTWSFLNRLSSLGLTVLYTAWFRLVPEPFRSLQFYWPIRLFILLILLLLFKPNAQEQVHGNNASKPFNSTHIFLSPLSHLLI